MTLIRILFGSNLGLRALNKIFLYQFLYFSYFDVLILQANQKSSISTIFSSFINFFEKIRG